MTELSWSLATKANSGLLQRFTCTVPEEWPFGARRPIHLRTWERAVQKWLRADALADANDDTNAGCDGRVLIGLDADGQVGACVCHAILRSPGIETPLRKALNFDGLIRDLKALAVALKYRGQGGGIADEALSIAFGDMYERNTERPILVAGRIDRRNTASEAFALRNGFELIQGVPEPEQLRNWFVVLEDES